MRWLLRSFVALLVALTGVVLTAWLVNRSPFDDDLIADVQGLKAAEPASLDQNAYPTALGFLAGDETDPQAAGRAMLALLNARYESGQPISLSAQERAESLGKNNGRGSWQSRLKSLECVARVDLDCADRLVAEAATVEFKDARFAVLSDRFERLLHAQQFDEGQRRDVSTPNAPYGVLRDIARVRLAEAFLHDPDAAFIARALDQLRFWKLVLREGQTLTSKMVALAAIQDTLDFLSALMRERTLTGADARAIEQGVSPLTSRELDIGDAFLTEARNQVLSEKLPLAEGAAWTDRLMLQRNATLNDFYTSVIQPLLLRAKLAPAEFHRAGGNRPLDLSSGRKAPLLFNRGGYRLVHEMAWDPEQFLARAQDQNGRLVLVALQAELEQSVDADDREVAVRSSAHRNPYTGQPMQYEVRLGTVEFPCLHTAYHPPAMPDRCAIRVDEVPATHQG